MNRSFCRSRWVFIVLMLSLGAEGCSPEKRAQTGPIQPRVEDYATMEGITNGVPVWSFSNLCYIYGVSPDLMPALAMQEGNKHALVKIKPKKSWEISYNLCGTESEMTRRSAYNDSQAMLPIHLIDGDPDTAWASFEMMAPNARPEWIRVDLPLEAEVASVALVSANNTHYGNYGKALPKELEVKTSKDAWHWDTVYANKHLGTDQQVVEIKFRPRRAKQIWIIGNNFPPLTAPGDFDKSRYTFSVGEVEVRDSSGANLALVSRGGSVTVSSTSYVMLNDRFTQDALWNSLNYDLGNKWVRIGGDNGSFMWHYVEHEKGQLRIDPVADESVTDLKRHGVNVILNLDFKGNWIYEKPARKTNWLEARFREINDGYNDGMPAADANAEMYQGYLQYVEYMARHFKDRVSYFELGNEWNAWFGPEHYMKTFFEPAFKIVKQVAPNARIMLGSPAGFDADYILDCLGRERKSGIESGKLVADGRSLQGASGLDQWMWRNPDVLLVRQGIEAKDVMVRVAGHNDGQTGIALRYKDEKHYLAAMYAASKNTIVIYEVNIGNPSALGDDFWQPLVSVRKFDKKLQPNLSLTAKVQGSKATFTVSDGAEALSTAYTIKYLNDAGAAGLLQYSGESPQMFANFVVENAQGKTLVRDDFKGPNGTIPAGWKYITGGPTFVQKGVAAQIDGIGWHPGPNSAAYFSSVREFQKKCRELGFKGEFFATEIYAGSMYPPGPPKTSSETQMAKFLVKSLVGHNGLGMEAGPCHPHYTAYSHPQALCQTTWGMQTLQPCRPTMAYYMWRTIATVMDDFHPAEFPITFSDAKRLLAFTFQRGDGERMVAAWLDGPEGDGITEKKSDIAFPAMQGKRARVVDIMNGTEQELDFAVNGSETVVKALMIKDYPVLMRISY